MTEEEYKKKRKRINHIFFGAAIAAIILWILSGYLIDYYSSSAESRGTFGDMFGMINALFSGLALGGVIYTILLQRLELELQRDEIRYSSKQLKGQKEILDKQNFEDKFFRLLSLHENFVAQVGTGEDKGKKFLSNQLNILNNNVKQEKSLEKLIECFNRIVIIHSTRSLFEFIISLIKFVDSGKNLNTDNKQEYINLFKHHLSNQELVLVIIHIYSLNSNEELLKLCEKYELFSHIQFEIGTSKKLQLIPEPNLLFNDKLPHLKKYYKEQQVLFSL